MAKKVAKKTEKKTVSEPKVEEAKVNEVKVEEALAKEPTEGKTPKLKEEVTEAPKKSKTEGKAGNTFSELSAEKAEEIHGICAFGVNSILSSTQAKGDLVKILYKIAKIIKS